MTKQDVEDPEYNPQPYDSVRPFAKGVTAEEYCLYLSRLGQPVRFSRNGDIWVLNSVGELLRLPYPDKLSPPSLEEIKDALRCKGIRIASYIFSPTGEKPANSFLYICRDSEYDISKLKRKIRNHVRKGLRNFHIRLCAWDEVMDKGYVAERDTQERHGVISPSRERFRAGLKEYQFGTAFEVWGAWDGESLAAWCLVGKIEDWAIFFRSRSSSEYLRYQPNVALRYCITKQMLVEEKRRWVFSGISSIYDGTRLGIHRYKLSVGYEAIPVHREFRVLPVFMPLMKSKAFSWIVERVEKLAPSYPVLRKANGLLRVTSGREKDPLSWSRVESNGTEDSSGEMG